MRTITFRFVFAAALFCALAILTVPASAQVGPFADVPKNHWAAQSVAQLYAAGVVQGTPAAPGAAPQKKAYDGNKPVTRYELAVTLYRFVQYIRAADKQRKTKQGAQVLPAPKNGADAVRRLVAEGYLPKNTPLATQGGKIATANELADALGFIVIHLREESTPISPDSELAIPQPKAVPGT